jgi:hypothetical protein
MLAPPVKGARTISRLARAVKTAMVALSRGGVTTRHVAASMFLCANTDRLRRRSREVRGQAQIGMERQESTLI